MPKGVEHRPRPGVTDEQIRVLDSLMPKGVEHALAVHCDLECCGVLDSLMPKGVEHENVAGLMSSEEGRAGLFDAERR